MHEIGVREVVHFAGLTFNWETLCMTWLTMAIVILISWLATRNLKMIPTGWQNVVEILVSWLDTQVSSMMGKRGTVPCAVHHVAVHVPADVELAGTHPYVVFTDE